MSKNITKVGEFGEQTNFLTRFNKYPPKLRGRTTIRYHSCEPLAGFGEVPHGIDIHHKHLHQ